MKKTPLPLTRAAVSAAALFAGSQARAGLLGYWNFDGPPAATTTERLKDLSGNNFHGNDRNYGGGTGANRVLFNNMDLPHAPFLAMPGNDNYCLDLTGADRYVIMEGGNTGGGTVVNIAASGAVDTRGDAFNIGGKSSLNQPITAGKLTVSFFFKGLPNNGWGNFVAKGGEGFGTSGIPSGTWEGWAVRRFSTNSRIAFTTRNFGLLTGNGDGDPGMDFAARSGGTLATPQLGTVAFPTATGIYSDNHASGVWQHFACVWDGEWKHWYVNGFQVRSEAVTSGVNVGTMSRLCFGADENPNTGAIAAGPRFSRTRMDEISIWDEALSPAQIEDLARGADPRRPLRQSIRPFDFGWPKGTVSSLNSFYPAGQGAASAIDGNLTNKYWNTAGRYSGLIVAAASSTARSFVITTAPDFPERDPAAYEIYGTTAALSSADNSGGRAEGQGWILLGAGELTATPGRSAAMPPVDIASPAAYTAYKVIFPKLNGGSTMQIGELQLYDGTGGTGALIAPTGQRAVAENSIPTGESLSPTSPNPAEVVRQAVDQNILTKWLSWGGATSGMIVTPAVPAAVQSLTITTANDSAGRDPASFELYGTMDAITSQANGEGRNENWTLISSGRLNLPAARRAGSGPVSNAALAANATAYTSYKIVFPTLGGDSLFQIADIQFYADPAAATAGLLSAATPVRAINQWRTAQNSAGSFFAGYTGGAILPQGGNGFLGLFEMRANGSLKRPEGTTTGTNATVYANDSPILYARWGSATAPTAAQYGQPNYPFGRAATDRIDYGDDNASLATGFNGIQTEFLTTSPGTAHDQFFQMAQGCFQVAAPGRYTFTLKGDDGSQLAIAGARWVAMYSSNGSGSFTGELLQNGFPTGDTNHIAVVEFPAAGSYNFRYQFNEQGGGAWNEVLYAQGERSAYDPDTFKQLGDSSGGLTLVEHKPIVELRTDSPVVQGGAPSKITLVWDACYATTTTLNGGPFVNQDVSAQTINGLGSITIPAPAVTTTYTVTGTRPGAPESTVSSSVTVYADAPPVLYTLKVDDATLVAGAPLKLRWSGLAGTTWSLSDGSNPAVDVTANTTGNPLQMQQGSITIPAPAADTTYTLTATNAAGVSAPLTVLVDIGVPPVISFTADRTSFLPGTYITLNWDAAGSKTQEITPRLNNSSLSNAVPVTGSQMVQPPQTTTWTITAANDFGSSLATVTVTAPDRLGIDAAGWTVQADYWNRFGYTDPVYGARNAVSNGIYQADEMFAISDAVLGARGPEAGLVSGTLYGPATAPAAQPGAGEKILMRYRQTGVPVINFDDALANSGNIPGSVLPPPAFASGVTYDQYAVKCTANLVVTTPGDYVIGMNHDDGARFRIDLNHDGDFNDAGELRFTDESYKGFTAGFPFTTNLSVQPGTYAIEYVYFEAAGGSGGEVFWIDTWDGCRARPLTMISSVLPAAPATSDVVISEFMAVNKDTLEDGEGSSPDWVELFNHSGAAVSLNGYFLTDDSAVPDKWAFPATAGVADNGYLLVYASGKGDRIPAPPAGELHTGFTLGNSGYLALTKSDGAGGYTVVSSYTYPAQRADVSYGWYEGTSTGYITNATPLAQNLGGATALVSGDTHFNVDRGIKSEPFDLTITADDTTPGTVIRYTTDGSTPTWLNGRDYTAPLAISRTTVVRAAAFRAGAVPTGVDTQTYIFPDDVLTQNTVDAVAQGWPNSIVAGQYFDFGMDAAIVKGRENQVKEALKAIPTVSLVTDITNLTDPACGIFVESQMRGRGFERNASVELINDDGSLNGNFQIDAGLRSRGGFSRSDGNPKHSWHLYFRNDYDGKLRYPVFGQDGASRFSQLDLATANNYSWSYSPENGNVRTFSYTAAGGATATYTWRYNTFIRDIASRDLQRDMSGLGSRNKYVHLYINGLYWGLHYFQERPEGDYAESYVGGNDSDYDVVKSAGNANGYHTEATDGDYASGIMGSASVDGTYASAWAKLYGGALDLRQRHGTGIPSAADNDARNVRFYKLMGLDYNPATGVVVRNPAYPVLLDVNNLIDYMLVTFYAGAYDAPLSTFLNAASNNWWALRDRTGERGFAYFAWDFEHGMGSDMLSGDATSGVATDIDYGPGVDSRNVLATAATNINGFRSTNRLGPWGGTTLSPALYWPSYQQFRGAFSTTNPEFLTQRDTYNSIGTYYKSNPQFIHENLAFAPEYRRMFGDRAQAMLRQNGPLTTSRVLARMNARADQLDGAIVAESARWGNAKAVALTNYDKDAWLGAVQNLRDWITHGSNQHVLNSLPIYEAGGVTPRAGTGSAGPGRAEVLIDQLRRYRDGSVAANNNTASPSFIVNGLFPILDAPVLSSWGGVVPVNTGVMVTNPNGGGSVGVIYYSLDGSDPRPVSGAAPAATALSVASGDPVTLTSSGTLLTRVYNSLNGTWSAAAQAEFVVGVPASAANLVVTEINYNPAAAGPGTPAGGDEQSFEFIELQNVSDSPVDLTGVKFTIGITYTFPSGRVLNAGDRIVVVRDPAAFASRYPDSGYPGLSAKTAGPFSGNLSGAGEQIVLRALNGSTIRDFTYDDVNPWPVSPDGFGSTLVFSSAPGAAQLDGSDPLNWFAHAVDHGNPGGPDTAGYDAWAAGHGVSGDGSGDADHDGVSDLLEYLLGSNPANGSSTASLPSGGIAEFPAGMEMEAYQTITFTRSTQASDLGVAVEVCDDLGAANWSATAVFVSRTDHGNGTETLVYRAPAPISADRRNFMRVHVTRGL